MKIKNVTIGSIDDSDRARKEYGDIDSLAQGIEAQGLIQPITVRDHPNSESPFRYKLLAGGRRLAACRQLFTDKGKIETVVRSNTSDSNALEIEMLENLQRKDFHWAERCELVYKIDKFYRDQTKGTVKGSGISKNWTIDDTAKVINKSHGGVHRQLELYKMLLHLPQLREIGNEDQAVKVARKIIEQAAIKKIQTEQAIILEPEEEEDDDEDGVSDEVKEQMRKIAGFTRKANANYIVGDAFVGLQEIIDMENTPPIGLCEVDPPYGIDLIDQKKGEGAGRSEYEDIPANEYGVWLDKLTDLLYHALPENCHVVFWYGHEWYDEVTGSLSDAGFKVDKIPNIWVKPTGQTQNPDRYLARSYEPFIYAWKGDPMIANRGRSNVFSHNPVPAANKSHPTQRPMDLILSILDTYTFPGQIVLSPFLGSGTTLLACYRRGNLCFGWDLSEKYKKLFMVEVDKELRNYHLKEKDNG